MNPDRHNQNLADRRRRYLVHLSSVLGDDADRRHYFVRIRPAAGHRSEFGERGFQDDCELIGAINPVLPPGSDVRDVFGHIENPNGFFYVLWLTDEEAMSLGWNANTQPSASA